MTSPVVPPEIRPRRLRLALSLRNVMLAILVLGVWLAWRTNRARDQQRAVVAVLETAGGEILYDWQEPIVNNAPTPGAKPKAPTFLRRWLGDEFFQDITSLRVGGRGPVSEKTLEAVGKLPNVRSLNLAMSRVEPEGMAKLSGMTSLKRLVLGNMRVTDEALEKLSGLTNLEELYLHWSLVETGTKHLAAMSKLRVITLSHSKLTDEGLESLVKLPGLKVLTIHDNPLSDSAVRSFIARRPDVTVEYMFPNPSRPPSKGVRP